MPTEIKLLQNPNPENQGIFMTFGKDIEHIPDDPLFAHSMHELGMPFDDLGEQPSLRFLAKTALTEAMVPNNTCKSLEKTSATYRTLGFDLPPNLYLHPTLLPHVDKVLEHSIKAASYEKTVWFIKRLGNKITATYLNERPEY